MLIDYDDAVWRIAVQLAFEADMEYPGEHMPTEYTDVARAWLKGIPTIEPKTGRWIQKSKPSEFCTYWWRECSVCGNKPPNDIYGHPNHLSPYCPNCGAKMKGADNE